MAEIDSAQSPQETKPMSSISFSIWPPTQRTRDAVINRLIESLSTPSILSKRYGTLPHDEASDAAMRIEGEAFAAAGSTANGNGNDDGIEILEIYSKEISKRMIDTVKSRSAPPVESETESKSAELPADASESSASGITGEVSSVENEP